MDEFKTYLREHRHELDVESPPRSVVWQHIQQQVTVRQNRAITPLFRRVAAACLVLLAGATAYMLWVREPRQEDVVTKPVPPVVKGKNPELAGQTSTSAPAISPLPGEVIADTVGTLAKKLDNPVSAKRRKTARLAISKKRSPVDALQENYAIIINMQLKKLETTPIHVESPGYFHAFKKEWYDMEKDEKKIKDDIRLYGLNGKALEQFIQLYQQKLLMLKQLQEEINKMNNRAQQYPEMQSKSPSYLKM
jgi:hypothetical protein